MLGTTDRLVLTEGALGVMEKLAGSRLVEVNIIITKILMKAFRSAVTGPDPDLSHLRFDLLQKVLTQLYNYQIDPIIRTPLKLKSASGPFLASLEAYAFFHKVKNEPCPKEKEIVKLLFNPKVLLNQHAIFSKLSQQNYNTLLTIWECFAPHVIQKFGKGEVLNVVGVQMSFLMLQKGMTFGKEFRLRQWLDSSSMTQVVIQNLLRSLFCLSFWGVGPLVKDSKGKLKQWDPT